MGRTSSRLVFIIFALAASCALAPGMAAGQQCLDGTLNGTCSAANPPLYCSNGNLIFNTIYCGANAGKCCQSYKNPALYAVYLAVSVPPSESCDNARNYFNETTIGGWTNSSFYEWPGIAWVIGGYPTSIGCMQLSFIAATNHGTRSKANGCIFAHLTNTIVRDRQSQVSVLDWKYDSDSFCVFNGTAVAPQKVVYTSTELSNCQRLDSPDTTYTLPGNLTQNLNEDCITVAARNITIDCLGNSIRATDVITGLISGVYSDRDGTKVLNCTIAGFFDGVYLFNSSGGAVANSTFLPPTGGLNNKRSGVHLNMSSGNVISGNAVFSSFYGLWIEDSDDNTISGNTITSDGAYGMWLAGSHRNVVTGNTAGSNSMHGIYLAGADGNRIEGNTAGSNGWHGIYLYGSSNNNVTGNGASSNGMSGIRLYDHSMGNTVKGNTAGYNSDGISIQASGQNVIEGNTIEHNSGCGVNVSRGMFNNINNNISGNTARSNSLHGICIVAANSNRVENNIVESNTLNGIHLEGSEFNTVTGNTAGSNGGNGIFLTGSGNNTLMRNGAVSNAGNGIYMNASGSNRLEGNTAGPNSGNGIYLAGSQNNTVTGNDADSNAMHGIHLDGSAKNSVTGNDANSNSMNGIHMSGSQNNTITGNGASSNRWSGIRLQDGSQGNNLMGNTAGYNVDGISVFSSGRNVLGGNTAERDSGCGINVTMGMYNNVTGNTAGLNAGNGICIIAADNNWVRKNTAGSNDGNGIYISGSGNNTVGDNSAGSNKGSGILLSGSANNRAEGNNASYNALHGIYLEGSQNTMVTGNRAGSNSWHGIYISGSSNNTVAGNSASLNGLSGIRLQDGSQGNVIRSNIAGYNTDGICFVSSGQNVMEGNNAERNRGNGINVTQSSYNNITSNNATLNAIGAFSDGSSSFLYYNVFCNNTLSDLSSANWLSSSGSGNTCDNGSAWNDIGVRGCFKSCSGNLTENETIVCNTAADTDCDAKVNISEVVNYINIWYRCSACAPELFSVINAFYDSVYSSGLSISAAMTAVEEMLLGREIEPYG